MLEGIAVPAGLSSRASRRVPSRLVNGETKPGKQKPRYLAVPGLAVGPTGIEPMTSTV